MTYSHIGPFEWDQMKADSNYKKHGVDFYEAMTVWSADYRLELLNSDEAQTEIRWIRIGYSIKAKLLVVIYTEKNEGEQIRIISARSATKKEELQYNSNICMVIK